ncbi:MAG: hypothetical protein F9K38_14235 [Pseudorhodoplanes sp.]|nr:MAG: hypothetical protein F9K38_14235 [Pseudorhodoplanes sp.]
MIARRPVFAALGLVTIAASFLFSTSGFATCDIRKTWSRYEHDRMSLESFFESCGRTIEETRGEARDALLKPYREWKEKKRREEEARIARERAETAAAGKREMERLRGRLEADKEKLRETEERNRKVDEDSTRARKKYELDKMRREEEKAVERFLHPEKYPEKPKTPPLGSTGERAPGGIRLGVRPTGSNADLSDLRNRVLNLPR